jgi:antitoxin CptB
MREPKGPAAAETPADRIKRLRLRSWRRGIREMDLILGRFADAALPGLGATDLDAYEALLVENDHDLYAWIAGRAPVPEGHRAMLDRIRAAVVPGF